MQIILDVKPSYINQVMSVLDALDKRFFNKIETPSQTKTATNQDMKKQRAIGIKTSGFKFNRDEANER